jgi:F420H(2)-dependent quinone reductase
VCGETGRRFNWQRMKNIQKLHRVLYAIGLGPIIGRIILLLTTVGRKTGLKRVTPLQYEEIEGKYYLGSARGLQADWVRNIQCNPQVDVRVKSLRFHGQAEVVTEPARIADFIEVRLAAPSFYDWYDHAKSARFVKATQPRAVGKAG